MLFHEALYEFLHPYLLQIKLLLWLFHRVIIINNHLFCIYFYPINLILINILHHRINPYQNFKHDDQNQNSLNGNLTNVIIIILEEVLINQLALHFLL